jgi:hypothetical protein
MQKYESQPAHSVELVNTADLASLQAHLQAYNMAAGDELIEQLQNPMQTPARVDEIAAVRSTYAASLSSAVERIKPGIVAKVAETYPEAYMDDQLPALHAFMIEHGMQPRSQPGYKAAYEATVMSAKEELVADLDQAEIVIPDSLNPENESIDRTLDDAWLDVQDTIDYAVDKIKRSLPVDSRSIIAQRVGAVVGMQHLSTRHPAHELRRSESTELNRLIGNLAQYIKGLRDNPGEIYAESVKKLTMNKNDLLEDAVEATLVDIALQKVRGMAEKIELALLEVATQPSTEISETSTLDTESLDPTNLDSTSEAVAPLPLDTVETETSPETDNGILIHNLGKVSSPFYWTDQNEINVQLIEQNGEKLVYCEALTKTAAATEQKLGQDAYKKKRMNLLVDTMHKVELSSNAQHHPRFWQLQTDKSVLEGHSIWVHGNKTKNASRLYYIVTPSSMHPEIESLLRETGITEDLRMIARLGVNDKANELDIFNSFGIDRRSASGRGAGSI